MRACFCLTALAILTIVTSVSAQSLPDEAGPPVGQRVSQQENITNGVASASYPD